MTAGEGEARVPVSYVLPIRHDRVTGDVEELASYLRRLATRAEVVVVDGSPPAVFAAHARSFGSSCRHLPPDLGLRFRNGKVNGVLTGLGVAAAERVVIADDDVRYDEASLEAVVDELSDADLVRPQNYFGCEGSLPWHARWDTSRTLLNRAFGQDYPGTLGVRRSFVLDPGGYDGDVLFENLQLIRTVRALGGRVADAPAIHVRRLPPTARRFWSQRVRQAYDELAQPARLAVFLAVVPAAVAAVRRPRALLAGAAACVAVAETGRRRAGGTKVFPFSATLFAPLWLLERGVCSWAAVGARLLLGGCPYRGTVIRCAAWSSRSIRRAKLASLDTPALVGAVAEGGRP